MPTPSKHFNPNNEQVLPQCTMGHGASRKGGDQKHLSMITGLGIPCLFLLCRFQSDLYVPITTNTRIFIHA